MFWTVTEIKLSKSPATSNEQVEASITVQNSYSWPRPYVSPPPLNAMSARHFLAVDQQLCIPLLWPLSGFCTFAREQASLSALLEQKRPKLQQQRLLVSAYWLPLATVQQNQ